MARSAFAADAIGSPRHQPTYPKRSLHWLDTILIDALARLINRQYKDSMEQVLSLSAIRARRADAQRRINEAQAELADLDIAERIVQRFGQAKGDQHPSSADMGDLLQRAGVEALKLRTTDVLKERALTMRALFHAVLRQSTEPWMTANEIQERASAIKGQSVPMATVSPTLSNMKNEGLIVRDGLKVALAERLNENGAGDELPSPAPETAQDAQ